MDLVSNGVIVNDAIKYVQGKMDHLNTEEKKLLQDIKDKGDAESEEEDKGLETLTPTPIETEQQQQQTHNRIF